ncbi:MAG: hypothetical protein QM831_03185 [Kofleriaceae bacterium]
MKVLVLLLGSAIASAAPLFEIDGTDKTVVTDDGTWTHGTAKGKLSADDVKAIVKDADGVPWTATEKKGIRCRMVHAPITYSVRGKAVWVDTGCTSKALDDASAKALEEIRAIVDKAQKSQP